MKFVHYDEPGEPEVLKLSEKELPQIKEDELLLLHLKNYLLQH